MHDSRDMLKHPGVRLCAVLWYQWTFWTGVSFVLIFLVFSSVKTKGRRKLTHNCFNITNLLYQLYLQEKWKKGCWVGGVECEEWSFKICVCLILQSFSSRNGQIFCSFPLNLASPYLPRICVHWRTDDQQRKGYSQPCFPFPIDKNFPDWAFFF